MYQYLADHGSLHATLHFSREYKCAHVVVAQLQLSVGKVSCSEESFCLLSDQMMLMALIREPSGRQMKFSSEYEKTVL